ncbi:AMP-binding protein [Massilia sp. MS-15]|uniref:AMP-binding protein n=1 Tax=Massilia sp. MS-15 TaxID=2878200 RepID=UPI001CD441E3|nr:capsule biosynthesis protein CapK [Massilia sp. MS-15]MCA1246160.1 capsule biosynthesis protein CapK [Massilia sp. MS-15]
MDPRMKDGAGAWTAGETAAQRRARFPTLGQAGRRMLDFLRRHPHAPIYRNHSGNRLLAHEIGLVRAFEEEVAATPPDWTPGRVPGWVMPFVADAFATVPFYRALGSPPRRLDELAPVARADLAADVARFVPDHVDTRRLLAFQTTGTTGHPLLVPSHPLVAARYAAFHKRALRRAGIVPNHGAGQVGVVLLGFQRRCFTYVSVSPTMGESGLAKINLHPADWRHEDDRARYLDALAPEIVAGDPISLRAYAALPCRRAPRAILSVSMALHAGLRKLLESRFGCPVLDIYSLNEVGPVAVHDEAAGGHLLLQPRLYVEILDERGRPVAPGERGEIAVTGGFNFCLPLLRYRTGDHAALVAGAEGPVLAGLCGRRPVRFFGRGQWWNNIDVTHALRPLPLSHFTLYQAADGSLLLGLAREAMAYAAAAQGALAPLFGEREIAVRPILAEDKVLQYSSDLPGACQDGAPQPAAPAPGACHTGASTDGHADP